MQACIYKNLSKVILCTILDADDPPRNRALCIPYFHGEGKEQIYPINKEVNFKRCQRCERNRHGEEWVESILRQEGTLWDGNT